MDPLHLANDVGTALLLGLHGARADRADSSGRTCLAVTHTHTHTRTHTHTAALVSLGGDGMGGLRMGARGSGGQLLVPRLMAQGSLDETGVADMKTKFIADMRR